MLTKLLRPQVIPQASQNNHYIFQRNYIETESFLVWLRYSFLVKDQEMFIKLFEKKFNLDIWYSSIFEGRYKNYYEIKYKNGSCPVAEYVSKHIVNFPTHSQIPLDTYKKIIKENWGWLKNQINYDKRDYLMLDGNK